VWTIENPHKIRFFVLSDLSLLAVNEVVTALCESRVIKRAVGVCAVDHSLNADKSAGTEMRGL
jgi:hypothetical protein